MLSVFCKLKSNGDIPIAEPSHLHILQACCSVVESNIGVSPSDLCSTHKVRASGPNLR